MILTLLLCGVMAFLLAVYGILALALTESLRQVSTLQDDIVALNDELTEAYRVIAIDTQLLCIQERQMTLDDQGH
jgi:hypothetical protein